MVMLNSDRDDDELLSEINVTPLVDVMLVLLVIFIVTAAAATTAVSVDLPRTERASPSAAKYPHPIMLSVDRQGSYRLDGQPVGLAALEQRLAVIHRKMPGRTAQLEADRNVAYGRVGKAMAALAHAGIRKIAILSSPQ